MINICFWRIEALGNRMVRCQNKLCQDTLGCFAFYWIGKDVASGVNSSSNYISSSKRICLSTLV